MMFLGKLLTALIGNDDVIVDSGLAKKPFCHFAVWTGGSGDKDRLGSFLCHPSWSFRTGTDMVDGRWNLLLRSFLAEEFVWLVGLPGLEFACLAVIPVLDRTVVSGDPGIDFGFLVADWTFEVFAGKIAVFRTDGIGRGEKILQGQVVLRLHVRGVLQETAEGEARRKTVRGGSGIPPAETEVVCEPPVGQGNREESEPQHTGRGDIRDPEAGQALRPVPAERTREGVDGSHAELPRAEHTEVLPVRRDREEPGLLEGSGRPGTGKAAPDFADGQERRREKEETAA